MINTSAKVLGGCAGALLVFGAAGLVYAGLGWCAAWVLSCFGVHLPEPAWLVCGVALFVLGSVFRSGGSSK